MNEASKPATWANLGFGSTIDDQTNGYVQPQQQSSAILPNMLKDSTSATQSESALAQFWNTYFEGLSVKQRKTLVHKLSSKTKRTQIEDLDFWIKGNKKFLQSYLSNHSTLHDDDIEKLRTSHEDWVTYMTNKTAEPDAKEVRSIRSFFRDSIYNVVKDRSAMNRSIESPAWNWSWAELSVNDSSPAPVSFIQLSGQPEAYRGHKVRISGSVRGMQKIDLDDGHELGFDSYKVLWVKPNESNRVPFCVYVKELPDDFPKPTDGFVTMNQDVTIDGIFFKLRSYEATNQQIEICPLIVADSIQWLPGQMKTVSAASWEPPTWLLTLFFIGMPMLAALLAWMVYQSTSSNSMAMRIGSGDDKSMTWNELSNRDDIKSDRERINELNATNR